MGKKDLTKASEAAVNKFFSNSENNDNINSDDNLDVIKYNNIVKHDNVYNDIDINKSYHVTNKSKHYDERGKRDLRHVLLLDKQLKEDLTRLCHATENRSVNDYIISLLIEHTEQPENKKLLENYQKLRDGVTV